MNDFGTRLENVTEDHLEALIDGKIVESRTIEYKATLPGETRDERAEFLRDVASFSNANGGHIIYGVEAKDGMPVKLKGTPEEECDAAVLRLEQIIRSGIEPQIFGLLTRAIPLPKAGGRCLVIEIPRGFFGPHMIKNRGAFYTRGSAGKVPLDVPEIRAAFIGAENLATRMREFRAERIARLLVPDGFPKMAGTALVVIHVLPFASFGGAISLDLASIPEPLTGKIVPTRSWNMSRRFSFDGVGNYDLSTGEDGEVSRSYALLLRNGCIESTDAGSLSSHVPGIPSGVFEHEILASIEGYREALTALSVPLPWVVGLSLLNMRGLKMLVSPGSSGGRAIDRDHLILPEFTVETADQNCATLLRPAFDAVWNACGFIRSFNYDEKEAFKPKRN